MTQQVFSDIDPNVTSGTELATFLNDFKASLLTQHSGATAPTYAVVGTQWFDSAVAGTLTMKYYDGAQWISQFVIDTVAHKISLGGNNPTASVTVSRTDTAADMIEMYRNTIIASNGGLIYSQNNDNSTKKTFGNIKIVADSVVDGAEDASLLFEAMIAGTLSSMMSVSKSSLFFESLKGTGDRVLSVNSLGQVTTVQGSSSYNIFTDGEAKSAVIGNYVVGAPLTLAISTTAAELIDSTSVFKAISTAASETFETAPIAISNGHIDSPMIVSIKYKASASWNVELINSDTLAVLETDTLNIYTQTLNEGRNKKFFAVIPSGVTNVKVKFTSSAADTFLYDGLEVYSLIAKEEPLFFEKDILNTQTNTNLFTIANRKNAVWKVEGQVIRETATKLADGIVSFYISNNGTIFRVGKEDVFDHESDLIETSFNMNGNILRYSTNDLTGATYTGKFSGTITRVL